MKRKLQRDIFRDSEGDAWFLRNFSKLEEKNKTPEKDLIVSVLKKLKSTTANTDQKLLEVGCGGGTD